MKTRFLLLFLLPLFLLNGIANGQAERTFVKSFNLMGRQTVVLNLGDNVQISQWDSEVMRIQMTVSMPSATDGTLKALAESGRYMLKTELTVHENIITATNLQKMIKLNGNDIKETVSYVVFAPKNITVIKNSDANPKIVAKLNP